MSLQSKLATVRRCSQVWEADVLRDRLNAAGIMAFVNGGESARTLSYVGVALGGVRVEVPVDQLERAEQVLVDDERQRIAAGRWRCPRCGEPNDASFDFCYSCSMPRDEHATIVAEGEDEAGEIADSPDAATQWSSAEAVETLPADPNPYRTPRTTGQSDAAESVIWPGAGQRVPHSERIESAEVSIRRATMLAVFGAIMPIPLLPLLSFWFLYRAWCDGAAEIGWMRRRVVWVAIVDFMLLAASTAFLGVIA